MNINTSGLEDKLLEPELQKLYLFVDKQIRVEIPSSITVESSEVRPSILFYEPVLMQQPLKGPLRGSAELLLEWVEKHAPDEEFANLVEEAEKETRKKLRLR